MRPSCRARGQRRHAGSGPCDRWPRHPASRRDDETSIGNYVARYPTDQVNTSGPTPHECDSYRAQRWA